MIPFESNTKLWGKTEGFEEKKEMDKLMEKELPLEQKDEEMNGSEDEDNDDEDEESEDSDDDDDEDDDQLLDSELSERNFRFSQHEEEE